MQELLIFIGPLVSWSLHNDNNNILRGEEGFFGQVGLFRKDMQSMICIVFVHFFVWPVSFGQKKSVGPLNLGILWAANFLIYLCITLTHGRKQTRIRILPPVWIPNIPFCLGLLSVVFIVFWINWTFHRISVQHGVPNIISHFETRWRDPGNKKLLGTCTRFYFDWLNANVSDTWQPCCLSGEGSSGSQEVSKQRSGLATLVFQLPSPLPWRLGSHEAQLCLFMPCECPVRELRGYMAEQL